MLVRSAVLSTSYFLNYLAQIFVLSTEFVKIFIFNFFELLVLTALNCMQVNVVSYKTRPNAKDYIQVEILVEKDSQKIILIGRV